MRIVIAGASGFLGSTLAAAFSADGHTVVRLVRGAPAGPLDSVWDPAVGRIDGAALAGADAVVNVTGAGIGDHRWTSAYKRELLDSRVQPASLLARTVAAMDAPPAVFISTSAVGWYGDRPAAELLTEESPRGSGFLSDLCARWEDAVVPAARAGVRTVLTRLGIALDRGHGALAKMIPPFLTGAGGRIAAGTQMVPWIAASELPRLYLHLIDTPQLSGPVNCVAPDAVSNAQFARALADALGRPTLATIPAFAIRTMFGEMGTALLLAGQHVVPAKLLASGYEFQYPLLADALKKVIGS